VRRLRNLLSGVVSDVPEALCGASRRNARGSFLAAVCGSRSAFGAPAACAARSIFVGLAATMFGVTACAACSTHVGVPVFTAGAADVLSGDTLELFEASQKSCSSFEVGAGVVAGLSSLSG